MKITIESTDSVVMVEKTNGEKMTCRVWQSQDGSVVALIAAVNLFIGGEASGLLKHDKLKITPISGETNGRK